MRYDSVCRSAAASLCFILVSQRLYPNSPLSPHLFHSFLFCSSVRYLPNMRFSIEKLLNAKKNLNYTKVGKAVPSWVEFKTFIHKMEIVMKKSMYGFYPKTVPFVKVSLLNPLDVAKVVSILEVPCCTVLYCIVTYCTVLYCTALYVLYCNALYCTALHCNVLHCNVLHCITL